MKKNIVIVALIIVLIVSIAFIIYSKKNFDIVINENQNEIGTLKKENDKLKGEIEKTEDTDKIVQDISILSDFIGVYEFSGNDDSAKNGGVYQYLKINQDGTAEYEGGVMNLGSVQKSKGIVAISDDKLYFYDENCNCDMNCTNVIVFKYSKNDKNTIKHMRYSVDMIKE